MFIGAQLRTLRISAGLSQRDLALAVNRGQPAVSAWESGRSNPSIDNLPAIAAALGVRVTDLIGPDPKRKGRKKEAP